MVVTVGAGTTGSLINTATVTGNQTDPNLANNTATATTPVIAQTDLSIAKSGSPNPVVAGNQLTYTLTTANLGPSNATGVTVTDTLPAGVQYVSAGGSGTVANTNGVLTVNLGNLASGASDTTTVVVTVGLSMTGTVVNTATVTGNQTDPNLANNTATCSTTVNAPPIKVLGGPNNYPDLAITKTASASSVASGSDLTYTLAVSNISSVTADGAYVTDTLPAGVTLVSETTSMGTISISNGTIRVNLGNMAEEGTATSTATITIVVDVTASAGTSITNTATVEPFDGNDANQLNNTSSVVTSVTAALPPSKWWFLGR